MTVRNAKGKKFKAQDANFKQIHDVLKDFVEYQVFVTSKVSKKIFIAGSENVVGAWIRLQDCPGHLVLLPYFDLSEMIEIASDEVLWTEDGLRASRIIVGQMVGIDSALSDRAKSTPRPDWVEEVPLPTQMSSIEKKVEAFQKKIAKIEVQIDDERNKKTELLKHTNLLFENGEFLENAIASALEILGYKVENFREGDLEIDHVIVGPSGKRMIGEAEGKDNTAVNISKFRQLESNINEDFERDEVDIPAKGLLFGNGYRLTHPDQREEQFTNKCLTNAKRLGTALIRTTDLYRIVVHLLDHPSDERFKEQCREAIESTKGDLVSFSESK